MGLTIAHVIAPGVVGGAETVVRALAIGRQESGGRTLVAALTEDPGRHPYVNGLREAGVPTVEIKAGGRRYLSEARALASALREARVDLVHTHVYHADFVGYRAARSLAVPVVATLHGETHVDWKNAFYQWIDRGLLRRFDAVVCVSEAGRDRLERSGCPRRLLHVIPNGYVARDIRERAEARSRLGLPGDVSVAGWVGRLSVEKGPDLFVRAIATAEVASLGLMIGGGSERDSTGKLIRELGVEDRVRLLGQLPEAATLFAGFDCLVISSRTEGLPMVLWEAVAANIPIVAFGVGGIPEVLSDDSAWLVRPADPDALGAAISEALSSPDESRRRAARARVTMEERYGLSAWVGRIEELYESAVHKRAALLG